MKTLERRCLDQDADAAAVAELEEMEEYDLYSAVRRYVLDQVEPFCDGMDAM